MKIRKLVARNYALIAYILAVAVPVGLVTAASWVVGFPVVSTVPGLLIAIALLIGCLLLAKHFALRAVGTTGDELVGIYTDECDPVAFVEQASAEAASIERPYDDVSAWFLSYYALALDDIGRRDEATQLTDDLMHDARETNGAERASMLVSIEPAVLRIYGVALALEVVGEAEGLLSGRTDVSAAEQRYYLAWERGVLEAMRDGDFDELLNRYSAVRVRDEYPLRTRVYDAILEARIHAARGEDDLERECLAFAVENAPKLPAAAAVRARLAQLDSHRAVPSATETPSAPEPSEQE